MSKKKTDKGSTRKTKTIENKKDDESDKISDTDSAEESAEELSPIPTSHDKETSSPSISPSISEKTSEIVGLFDKLIVAWAISVMFKPLFQLISSSYKSYQRTGKPETKRLWEALEQIQASKIDSEIEQFRKDLLERIKILHV